MKEAEVKLGKNENNPLTPHQMENLNLAAMGLSNKEIAEESHTTVYAVDDAFRLISKKLGKLGVHDRCQALVLAIDSGWLDPEQCVGESNLSLFETLTPRQLKVVEFVARGKTNVQIAEDLFYSMGSISRDLTGVYSCLGINPGNNSHKKGRVAVLYYAHKRRNNV